MLSIVVWMTEFWAEVVLATIAQFVTEVFVGWVTGIAEAAIAEWLTVVVAEVTGLFAELFTHIRR